MRNVAESRVKWFVVLLVLILAGCGGTPKRDLSKDAEYQQSRERVAQWKVLIREGNRWGDMRRLTVANDFVNRLLFVDDIVHWGKEDYWATPLQTLVTGGGDCEDFSLAKYFTLVAMGMEKAKIRMTYVNALTIDKPHMVVSYYPYPNAQPLVLDNLDPEIRPASQRSDLLPVYSFNADGLWLAKRGSSETYVGDTQRISLWQQLLKHMDAEAADEESMICLYYLSDLPEKEAEELCR